MDQDDSAEKGYVLGEFLDTSPVTNQAKVTKDRPQVKHQHHVHSHVPNSAI
jgi:hypothetical protein